MTKKLTFLIAAAVMLLTMMATTGTAFADNASYVFNTDAGIAALGITKPDAGAGTALSTTTPYVVGQISMTATHGSTNTRVWNSNGTLDLRIYKSGGTLTFASASGYKITGITITGSTTNVFSVNVGSYSNGSWSNSTTGATSVTFTATGTGKINTITVTYESTGSSTDPSISASDVNIAYNAEGGSIEYTLANATGNVSASVTTGDWLTLGTITSSAVPFTCTANTAAAARTATVTLSFTGASNKVVTVTQAGNPNVVPTIAEVRAQGTGSVITKGIVTSCVGTTGYIQDATAAICVYGSSLTVGDEIRVEGTLTTYKGLLEITSPTITVLSSSNTVTPTVKTIAEINADDYTASTSIQGLYVTIEEATVNSISGQNVTIAQSTNTIVVRFANTSDITFDENDIITLDGNIGCYNGAQIANPQNVEIQQNEDPYITANDVNITYDATGGNIAYTVENPVQGGQLTATTTSTWLTLGTEFASPIAFTCTANTAANSRTATVTLTYTYGAKTTVNKEVTVTQAGNPDYTMTIAEVRPLATGTTVTTKGIVTSITENNGKKTAYMQDNTAGIVVYGAFETTVAVGDEIRVEGELTAYKGLVEIGTSSNAPTVTVLSQSNTVTPAVKTIAEIDINTHYFPVS